MVFSIALTEPFLKHSLFKSALAGKYDHTGKDETFNLSLYMVNYNTAYIKITFENIKKIYKQAKEHINDNKNDKKINAKNFEDCRSKKHINNMNNDHFDTEFIFPYWFTKKKHIFF